MSPRDATTIGRRRFLGLAAAGSVGLLAGCASGAGPGTAPLGRQLGFCLPTYDRHGYRDFDTAGALRELRSTGAGWVQIVPTWYQEDVTADEIAPTAASVEADDVREAIALAHDAGLRVLLKPHVDVLDGTDRAAIEPADRGAWFRSYRAFLAPWSALAHDEGVAQFCVGTELGTLAGDRTPWLDVVADTRARFGGAVVYAANDDDYADVAFWDAVDLAGVDGYWPLARQATTDVAALEVPLLEVRRRLAAFAARTRRRVLLTEAGFPSQVGAAVAPWDDQQSAVPAPEQQAAGYRAVLSAFTGQPWWAGVFWWTWTVPPERSLATPLALDHSVRGKAAERVVSAAWHRA